MQLSKTRTAKELISDNTHEIHESLIEEGGMQAGEAEDAGGVYLCQE